MKNKTTIYCGKPIQSLFKGNLGSVSGKLNQVVDRYMLVCDYNGFTINDVEAQLLKHVFRDCKYVKGADILDIENRILSVNDSDTAHKLLKKIDSATLADFVAVIDKIGL